MGGLSFIHLGFLAGAAAVAVPLAIHLLFRPRPRQVDIGSLWFLKVVLRDHARRRRLRRWILLALRVAGILLLAILFARPYWSRSPSPGDDREVALVIDRSASMAARSSGKTSWDRALDGAEAVLKDLPERTATHVAYADGAGVEAVKSPRIDRALGPGYAGTDHARALAWARDKMVLSRRAGRKVYLFTDLQRPGTAQTPADWPQGVEIEVVDVGRPLARNLAVTDVRVDRAEIRRGEPFVVSALLANTGLFPVRNVAVRLALAAGGTTVGREERATIEAGATQPVRFALDALAPGSYRGTVAVESDDDLPIDDTRWVAFEARTTDRVLLVDGEPGRSAFQDETYFLETALRLRLPGQGVTATPYEPVRLAWGGGTMLPDLANFRVVIAANVGRWSDTDARGLRKFLDRGGSLIVFGGEQVGSRSLGPLRRAGVVTAGVVESGAGAEGVTSYRIASWEKDHPIFRSLSDPQHGDLRRLEFRQLTHLEPGPEARVLARVQTGEPWLVEGKVGAGRVLVFAAAADRDGGDWPVGRLFLPLVHQVLGDLTGRLADSGRVRSSETGPGRTNPPGVVREGGSVVVRNLDPRESEVDRVALKAFRLAYRLPSAPTGRDLQRAGVPIPGAAGSERPDELWRPLAWGLFVVLVIETFVANRTSA